MSIALPRRRFLSLLGVAPWVAAGCSEAPVDTFDRNAMLAALADNVFVPSARLVASSQAELAAATLAFANGPTSASLTTARAAWRSARRPLKRAQAFSEGPFFSLHVRSALDWFPSDTQAIDRVLAGTMPLNRDTIETLGASQRGMPAVEYLLFARETADADVVARFIAPPGAERRRDYLRAVGAHSAAVAEAYARAWERGAGDYAGQLSTAGRGSATFTTTRAAVDLLVNQLISAVNSAAMMRLGVPVGAAAGGVAQPEAVESRWSDNSIDDIRAILDGVDAVYTGTLDARSGLGVRDLVRSRNASTDAIVRARTIAATTALSAIRGPLREAVVASPMQVHAALDAVRSWKQTLQVDVANLLGVTVTFADGDGD